jgi:tripartite-type tricarboxylate transporter receptor subunit TctC
VIADILGGRIDLYFCPLATALPLIREGQVRALVVSTATRAVDLPDVPAMAEIGLKDAASEIWFAVFVPSKTPRDIVERLHAAGDKVLGDPGTQAGLKKLGIELKPMKPAEIDDLLKREIATTQELIKAANIKP